MARQLQRETGMRVGPARRYERNDCAWDGKASQFSVLASDLQRIMHGSGRGTFCSGSAQNVVQSWSIVPMRGNRTIELFSYWNTLRAGRRAPKRSEIEPADIKALLPDTFILERNGRGDASFRLAGTRLCNVHGRELKGFSFASLWRLRDQALASRMVENAFKSAAVVVMTFRAVSQKGRSCEFELLLLPLDGGEQHPRCLGIMTASEPPFWLGADPIVECAAESVRVVDPDREPLFLANRPAIEVPSLTPASRDLSLGGRRVGHLLVLDGGLAGESADAALEAITRH
jgi:hypothetical protein